jgi:hypothetical protein
LQAFTDNGEGLFALLNAKIKESAMDREERERIKYELLEKFLRVGRINSQDLSASERERLAIKLEELLRDVTDDYLFKQAEHWEWGPITP